MKRSKGAKLIELTAAAHRVSVAEIRLEIQKAIDIAFENKDKNAFQKGFGTNGEVENQRRRNL